MPSRTPIPASPARPRRLLTQNRELRAIGVWNWTLPALAARLPDGRTQVTCPAASACTQICYARNGTYNFPAVKAKHIANLTYVLDDLSGWAEAMIRELSTPRLQGKFVRVHDAGDFFSDAYTMAWCRIMRSCPHVTFYAYTKEIRRFKRLIEPNPPDNFLWVYSYGGREDSFIDADRDRIADVFPDEKSIAEAGWSSQEASDLLAVLGPRLVGVPANHIPHFLKRMGSRRLSDWQAEIDAERNRKRRRHLQLVPRADAAGTDNAGCPSASERRAA
ncbi:GP88 family protein [Amycolatopsis sp. cmx-4-68]|uniref:GP88 family protein n=1 Tax=Amycolatopsis sp. cmx-4-68 TaxID=2790938 RepID=UPI00397E54C0